MLSNFISKIKQFIYEPIGSIIFYISSKFGYNIDANENINNRVSVYDLSGVGIRVLNNDDSINSNQENIVNLGSIKVKIIQNFEIEKMKGYTTDISGVLIEIVDDIKPDKVLNRRKSILEDTKTEKITSIGTSSLEMVKIAMATLLSIFVPQYCPETGTTCSLQDNFSNLTKFNELVIVWNFITLGYFIKLLYVSNKRENYFIKTLDESHDEPYNSLVENMHLYPLVLRTVEEHNFKFRKTVYVTTFLFIFNILLSSLLVFNDYYDGFRTATTLIANVLLVSQKLYSYHYLINECCKPKQQALSAVFNKPISYNVIDDKFMLPADYKRYITKKRAKQMKKLKRSSSFSAPRERKY